MTKTMKLKKSAKAAASTENVKGNVEKTKVKLTEKKDLKYQYPKDCNDLEKRKAFRTKARAKRDGYLKKIAKSEAKGKPALIKEAKAWAAPIFTKEAMPIFK